MSFHAAVAPVGSPTSTGGPKAAAAAAAAAESLKARLRRSHIAQLGNEKIAWQYAVAMSSLIALFTIFHWSRYLYSRHAPKGLRKSSIMRVQVAIARLFRNVLTRKIPGFTSVGHFVLVSMYLAINIALTVVSIDWSTLGGIAKRCGWMALLNMSFITLLSLKNTPLAYLTAYSYERLNALHQVGGYTTMIYVFIHMIVFVRYFRGPKLYVILEHENIYGMVAGASMFVTVMAAITLRRLRYELFYVTHIVMFIIIIVMMGLHRPDLAEKAAIITIVAGSMWAADRLLRGSRILWYSHGNRATITPLSNGGTRIVLSRSPSRAIPGNHCFVWIPKIRLLETHPFTIVSTTPNSLELVVAAYDGFTNDLHNYAIANPGVTLQASVDGSYGVTPNFANTADKIILVAGGSGASFTFGVALDTLKKLGTSRKTTIDFVWCVKEHGSLSWFKKELAALQSSPLVVTHIHVTRSTALHNTKLRYVEDEKDGAVSNGTSQPSLAYATTNDEKTTAPISTTDIEKSASPITPISPTNPWSSSASLEIISGRPDVKALIQSIVAGADSSDRIAIGACGPEALMKDVRNASASVVRISGPSVELHSEQFGW